MSEAMYLYEKDDFTIDTIDTRFFKDTRKPNKHGLFKCTLCGEFKSRNNFYKDSRVPCGVRSRCKACYHKKGAEHE
jgi:hypothetical protein